MKNIKDITISIFAVIGFVSIITGFTYNQTQEPTKDWDLVSATSAGGNPSGYIYNTKTGEVFFLVKDKKTRTTLK